MTDQYNPESQAEWDEAFPDHAAARDVVEAMARAKVRGEGDG